MDFIRLGEGLFLLGLTNSFGKCRDNLKQVANYPEVSHGEDGGLGVFVDCDDCFSSMHSGKMLDSTGDTNGDI